MAAPDHRLNVTRDSEHALDEADPDARNVADLLDGIPGAYEQAQLGLKQAGEGRTIPLEEL
jgi:hypothetical protein